VSDRVQADGEAIYEALQRLVKRLLARKTGGHPVDADLDVVDVSLTLALKGHRADAGAFSEELIAAVERQVDEAIERSAAFRPGHAYCHRCGGSACAHSAPPDSRQVFVGYAPTGTPQWTSLPQYCLEMKHPEVQRLYEERPAFLTLSLDADTLRGELLDAWSNPSYELLAQLVAGYFRVPARHEAGPGLMAVTFQVTAANAANGRLRLGLNVLGRTPEGGDLPLLFEQLPDLPWQRSIAWAHSSLATVTRPRKVDGRVRAPSRADIEERVAGILGGLARRLERDQRGRQRRTAHAQKRHASGERPTRKAMDDVRKARPERILVDERSGTLVVVGDRGRTHFMTPEGKLVSSVRYSRDAIDRKRKLRVWRDASPEEAQALLGVMGDEAGEAAGG
jgi:hypothetical protein